MSKIKNIFLEAIEKPYTIDGGCDFTADKHTHFDAFCEWCKEKLDLPNLPKIHILDNRNSGITTGGYNPNTHEIQVYGKGRALIDILRTLAHELTHYRQRLQDRIKSSERDWNLESEADTEAGKMVYTYAHSSREAMAVYDVG
jgi:hypothetical protein